AGALRLRVLVEDAPRERDDVLGVVAAVSDPGGRAEHGVPDVGLRRHGRNRRRVLDPALVLAERVREAPVRARVLLEDVRPAAARDTREEVVQLRRGAVRIAAGEPGRAPEAEIDVRRGLDGA